jgi:acyl-CoA synthetase (AMP-forming)/AMP-acid ligase II
MSEVEADCVIGVPDEEWGESVKAIVELKPGKSLTEDDIRTRVAEKIASFKKPRSVEFVEEIPRTEDGETDRAAVKEKYG